MSPGGATTNSHLYACIGINACEPSGWRSTMKSMAGCRGRENIDKRMTSIRFDAVSEVVEPLGGALVDFDPLRTLRSR